MIQELSKLGGTEIQLAFTPHLLPINRGILSTIYFRLKSRQSLESLRDLYLNFYRESPFVRVRPLGYDPQTADVRGSNFLDLGFYHDPASDLYKVVSVIDNLCRGAGGQAVVNFNLMTGKPESFGLNTPALRP
jgi:N-acetyl-gamma-glutamyl-phosphate reductase